MTCTLTLLPVGGMPMRVPVLVPVTRVSGDDLVTTRYDIFGVKFWGGGRGGRRGEIGQPF